MLDFSFKISVHPKSGRNKTIVLLWCVNYIVTFSIRRVTSLLTTNADDQSEKLAEEAANDEDVAMKNNHDADEEEDG